MSIRQACSIASVLLLWMTPGVTARAQEPAFNAFERSSRFSVAWPKGYLYEGDPAAAIYLWSGSTALRAVANQDVHSRRSNCGYLDRAAPPLHGRTATGCTFVLVPHFVIRQMEDSSAAVKPPSFNPYFEWTSYRMSPPAPIGFLSYLRVRLAHYSNGQAGCTYVGDTLRGKDEPCGRPASVTADVPNTDDGDFSTSYIEPGIGVGIYGLHEGQLGGYLLLDMAPTFHATKDNLGSRVPGAMNRGQLRTYGNHEFTGELRGMIEHSRTGLALHGALLHNWANRAQGFPSWRSDATIGITSQLLFGFGVFVRRSRGYDYYNIGYGRPVDDRPRLSLEFHPDMGRRRVRFNDSYIGP